MLFIYTQRGRLILEERTVHRIELKFFKRKFPLQANTLNADMKIYSFTITHSLQWIMYAQVEIILKRNFPLVMRNYNEALRLSLHFLHFSFILLPITYLLMASLLPPASRAAQIRQTNTVPASSHIRSILCFTTYQYSRNSTSVIIRCVPPLPTTL